MMSERIFLEAMVSCIGKHAIACQAKQFCIHIYDNHLCFNNLVMKVVRDSCNVIKISAVRGFWRRSINRLLKYCF